MNLVRVNVIVEGETEESFVAGPLYSALMPFCVFLQPIILGVPGHKGGMVTYARVRGDLLRTLKQDQKAYCTTLIDLYGIGEGFPGQLLAPTASGQTRVINIETGILADIVRLIPEHRPDVRLIPYVQPYEFEGLLFSDPDALAEGMFQSALAPQIRAIRNAFANPEEINDNPMTAPSKRIKALDRGYNKIISGTLAAERMGISVIRRECPHFDSWVDRLSALTPL
jgi:hypothetical protein